MTAEIQDKEIRGITGKVIFATLVSLVSIVATVLGTYSSIVSKIEVNRILQETKFERIEYEIQGLNKENDQRKIEHEDLKKEVKENKEEIDFYHVKKK